MPTAQMAADNAIAFGSRNDATGNGAVGLAKLRSLSVADILADQAKLPNLQIVSPMIDGQILTEEPGTTFAQGRMAHVPYLAGSNSAEATLMPALHMSPSDMLRPLGDQAGLCAQGLRSRWPVDRRRSRPSDFRRCAVRIRRAGAVGLHRERRRAGLCLPIRLCGRSFAPDNAGRRPWRRRFRTSSVFAA